MKRLRRDRRARPKRQQLEVRAALSARDRIELCAESPAALPSVECR